MQLKEDGLYWVLVKFFNPTNGLTLRYDWALGLVRNGHFSWHSQLNNSLFYPDIRPISLRDLIDSGTKMVKIEKPAIDYSEPINFEI